MAKPKGYDFAGTVKQKSTANDVASKMRKQGYLVRVVKEKTQWGNYTIYRKLARR